jgi:hypothetical protein
MLGSVIKIQNTNIVSGPKIMKSGGHAMHKKKDVSANVTEGRSLLARSSEGENTPCRGGVS